RERPFLAILLSLFTAQLALRGLEPLTPLYVEQLAGGGERATVLAGLVYGAAGVGTLVASPLLGWYGDRRGHRLVLEASLLVACVSSLAQYFAGDPWTLAVWRVVLGIGIGGILPSTNAIAGGLAPEAGKGSVYGLLSFATFLGNAIGPVAGTVVAAAVGIRFIFAAAAGLLLVNAAWVTWVLGAAVRRTGHPAHHAC
ncbi:MAG: MFS transporter, partial [Clostridia bacterium]|nr:MFS transporter [Clostridia bacterium]